MTHIIDSSSGSQTGSIKSIQSSYILLPVKFLQSSWCFLSCLFPCIVNWVVPVSLACLACCLSGGKQRGLPLVSLIHWDKSLENWFSFHKYNAKWFW